MATSQKIPITAWLFTSLLLVLVLLSAACDPTATPGVEVAVVQPTSQVQRKTAVVYAGNETPEPLPTLGDYDWHGLEPGGLVSTDDIGQALVNFEDCSFIYVFRNSGVLMDRGCDREAYLSAGGSCVIEGTSAYRHECEPEVTIETRSASLIPAGTDFAVSYLEKAELTVLFVFSGKVAALPVGDTGGNSYEPAGVAPNQIWFNLPGDKPVFAGLEARRTYDIAENPEIFTQLQQGLLELYPDFELWQLDLMEWGRLEQIQLPPVLWQGLPEAYLFGRGDAFRIPENREAFYQAAPWSELLKMDPGADNFLLRIRLADQPAFTPLVSAYAPDQAFNLFAANLSGDAQKRLTLLVIKDDPVQADYASFVVEYLSKSGLSVEVLAVGLDDFSLQVEKLNASGQNYLWFERHP